jgi:hypothetical protein
MNAVPRLVQEVLLMSKHSSHTLQIMQQAAAFRLRQLLDELGMVISSFPDLRDAFDPDELPLEFILKRDSQTEPVGRRLRPIPAPVNATSRGMLAHAAEHRSGPRKQITDE